MMASQNDLTVSRVPHKQLGSRKCKRHWQEMMEINAKKNKKRRLREEEVDFE